MTIQAALNKTKAAHKEIRAIEAADGEVSREQLKGWQQALRVANAELARAARELAAARERGKVEHSIFRAEMRLELVEREANLARTAERHRVLFERNGGVSQFERAVTSAASIESAISSLSTSVKGVGAGTRILANRAIKDARVGPGAEVA